MLRVFGPKRQFQVFPSGFKCEKSTTADFFANYNSSNSNANVLISALFVRLCGGLLWALNSRHQYQSDEKRFTFGEITNQRRKKWSWRIYGCGFFNYKNVDTSLENSRWLTGTLKCISDNFSITKPFNLIEKFNVFLSTNFTAIKLNRKDKLHQHQGLPSLLENLTIIWSHVRTER